MDIRKVNPGDRLAISASTYNAFVDAAAAHQRQLESSGGDEVTSLHRIPARVRVRNSSGANRAVLDVVLVGNAPAITPATDAEGFKYSAILDGTAVSSDTAKPFIVCAEPIAIDGVGWAYASGIFPARININDANHTHAGLKSSDSTQLDSSFAGPARILYKESGTGTKLAVVQYPVVPVGKTTSPTTIGAASEGSESADSTTWTRSSAGTPLEEWYCSRVGYWHSGDEKLYAFYRKRTYDSLGLLLSVSAETRVEIDAPEDC